VGIGPRPMLGVSVGVEVVCSLLLVSYRSGSQTVKCINMFDNPTSLKFPNC